MSTIKLPSFNKEHDYTLTIDPITTELCKVSMWESVGTCASDEKFFYDVTEKLPIWEAVKIAHEFCSKYPVNHWNSFTMAMEKLFYNLNGNNCGICIGYENSPDYYKED